MTHNFKYITQISKSDEMVVDLERIKQFLRIDHDDEDELLILFEKSAVEEAEYIIGKTILRSKWKLDSEILLDNYDRDFRFSFPFAADSATYIRLRKNPIHAINNVISDGQEVDPSAYRVIVDKNITYLEIKHKGLIGTARGKCVQIGIIFESGLFPDAKSVPDKIKTAILLHISQNFYNRDVICSSSSTATKQTMRSILSVFRDYFID